MDIKYTSHAVQRMQERNITHDQVALIIANPNGIIHQSSDKTIRYRRFRNRKDNLLAAVMVEAKADHYEVITVMVNFEVKK